MLLKTFVTGSHGNVYEICDGQTTLLLECGVTPKALRGLVQRKLTDYAAVLVTHEHMDHAKAAAHMAGLGVPAYMSGGTAYALGLDEHPMVTCVETLKTYAVGTIRFVPFRTVHDSAEPCGYLIGSTVTGDKLMFATDTLYIPARFSGLTEIAIEANYDPNVLEASSLPEVVRERIKRSHMSIDKALSVLDVQDLARVERIHLLHLSDGHSDALDFVRRVEDATGIQTEIG